MKDVVKLRLVNMIGCFPFVAYDFNTRITRGLPIIIIIIIIANGAIFLANFYITVLKRSKVAADWFFIINQSDSE